MSVGEWLRSIGLGQYETAFQENEIDSAVLRELTAEDLTALGVNLVGHRRKLLAAIAALRGTPASANAPALSPTKSTDAQRRQLTVMFVDLVGSTTLSGRLDPEDMSLVITAFQNTVAGVITRFQGHVAKYMGDGILCYFGWPVAHEDDAERAARAGLAIMTGMSGLRTPAGEPMWARIGIATGLVVVGDLIGAGAAQEEAVVGETPNLAARLQGLAAPGQIILAHTTRRLIGNAFAVADIGGHSLKGIAGEVRAYAVTGERAAQSRFEARTAGAISAMVGRDQELASMLKRWNQAKGGQGQLVLLSGEAGIGKSRVMRAMIDAVAREPHVQVSYQCSPYHTDSPLYPAIQQLTFAAGFRPDDGSDEKLDRLEAMVHVEQGERALLGALLGLDAEARYGKFKLTPQQQRVRTLEALVSHLMALALDRPVLFVVEDAHWIDATTLDLIDLCLERVASARVMMLVTARPNFRHEFGGRAVVTKLALNRLGRGQVRTIIDGVTGGKTLPDALVDLIAAKTDGVPLFVEEITKTVLESGAMKETDSAFELTGPLSHLAIPSTLHDSLMARLDRLQPVKEVAQTAACIGRDFDFQLLRSVSSLDDVSLKEALERLVQAELIFRSGVPPDDAYVFKHALVRDAAYENLLRTKRQAIHVKLVEALAAKDVAPELLAHHASMAGMTEKACRYWLIAGERAAARSANKEAISHLNAGTNLIRGMPDTQEKLRLELDLHSALVPPLMAIHGYSSEAAGVVSSRAVDLGRRIGDPVELAAVLWQAWLFNFTRANHGVATSIAREIEQRMQHADDPAALIVAHVPLGLSLIALGKPVEARLQLEQATRTYRELKGGQIVLRYGMEVGAVGHAYEAWCLGILGFPERALKGRSDTLEIVEKVRHPYTSARGLYWCAVISAIHGEWRTTLHFADRAVKAADEHGFAMAGAVARVMRGAARAVLHPSAHAIAEMHEGLDFNRKVGARTQLPFMLTLFAEALLATRDVDGGLVALQEASAVVQETGEQHVAPEIHRLRAKLNIECRRGDPHQDYRLALRAARSQGARLFELRAALDLTEWLREHGRVPEARKLLAEVYGGFTEGFGTLYLKNAKALLDSLSCDNNAGT
ncbi:MAG: AAA family ATPase [Hyphomicrobiales bacterium]|nr:AAA family ATPase [Hyphomicrobiales bacterium]